MHIKQQKWTDADIKLLVDLFYEGMPTSEIGPRLGRSKNSAIGKLHRLGLMRGSPKPAQSWRERQRAAIAAQLEEAAAVRRAEKLARRRERARQVAEARKASGVAPPPKRTHAIKSKVPVPGSFPVEEYVPQKKPPKPLVSLTAKMCHWPVNSPPRGTEYLFCGAPMKEWPYCPEHTRIAFRGLHN